MRHAPDESGGEWREALRLMRRPQPVTLPMVALFGAIPFYILIGESMQGRTAHAPRLALDALVPLAPAWSVVYGSLFLAALLPVFVIHHQDLVRRTILAFLMLWLASYAIFLAYPTVSPRPAAVPGDGFFAWLLREIHACDVRYNCFPSLHVAQCFLAAGVCGRVHRGVGALAMAWATLVALSTLFTKQHYVLDVLAGIALAAVAFALFVRGHSPVPEHERRLAPRLAAVAVALYVLLVVALWAMYAAG